MAHVSGDDKKTKLAVFGATGPTGLVLVEQAIAEGYHVRAIVRNPSKLSALDSPHLEISVADIFSAASLTETMADCDIVLCALGAPLSIRRIDLMTRSIRSIVSAMEANGIRRFVGITSCCTTKSSDHPFFYEWYLKPLFLGRSMDDFRRMEEYLANDCSSIDYTVVKPYHLTNDSLNTSELCIREGQYIKDCKYKIPRANVAKFMLDCLKTDTWSRKLVTIAFM